MADRAVRRTDKDDDGDITALAIRRPCGNLVSKHGAITDIETGVHSYHSAVEGWSHRDPRGPRSDRQVLAHGLRRDITQQSGRPPRLLSRVNA